VTQQKLSAKIDILQDRFVCISVSRSCSCSLLLLPAPALALALVLLLLLLCRPKKIAAETSAGDFSDLKTSLDHSERFLTSARPNRAGWFEALEAD